MKLDSLLQKATGSKILYNVTFRLEDMSTILEPRVPYSAAADEDSITQRVCFSDSIEGCLSAIGPCHRSLYIGSKIVVRSVDMSSLNQTLLVRPEELASTGQVPDAEFTREYWYLNSVIVNRREYIVKNFTSDYCLNWYCIKKSDVDRIAKRFCRCLNTEGMRSAEDVYNTLIKRLHDEERHDDSDTFDELVSELPWAQAIRFTDLVLLEVTEAH